jgi:hypothetical protein
MCDYSLMTIRNRLAVEGEELVAHRFEEGSIGLVSLTDFTNWQARRPRSLWQWFNRCFLSQSEPAPVVCVPPGARLRLHDFGAGEEATFTQISPEASRYRDALRFDSGNTMLLQLLPEGQRLTVLRFSGEGNEPDAQSQLVRDKMTLCGLMFR